MQRRYISISVLALSIFTGSVFAQTKWDLPAAYAATSFHSENLVQFAKDVDAATAGKCHRGKAH